MDASTPRPKPAPWQIWHPNHGIRFSPPPSTSRLSTVAAVETKQDLLLQSQAEEQEEDIVAPVQKTIKPSASTPLKSDESKPSELPSKPIDPVLAPLPPNDPRFNYLPVSGSVWKASSPLFYAAKKATLGTPDSYWSHTLYRHTTTDKKVTVHYCKSLHTTERVLQTYFSTAPLLGFDIEWLANASRHQGPRSNVSLIQIASESRIALFHLALYTGPNTASSLVSPTLKKILEDPKITKVGVAIKSDSTRLRNNLSIHPRGLFELSHLYKLLKHHAHPAQHKHINKKLVSLAQQTQEHLHLPMFKGESVRGGDWSRTLDLEQIRYAAGDSYAAVQLYLTMEEKRKRMKPAPPRPWCAELNLPIRVAEDVEVSSSEEDEGEGEGEGDGEPEEDAEGDAGVEPVKRRSVRKAAARPYPATPAVQNAGLENLDPDDLVAVQTPADDTSNGSNYDDEEEKKNDRAGN